MANVLSGFYRGIEDSYYKILDSIDKAGVPVYKVVDAIESKGIPSFPVAIIALVLVVCLLLWAFVPGVFVAQGMLKVSVADESDVGVENALVSLSAEGMDDLTGYTNDEGIAEFAVPLNLELEITVEKSGYAKKSDSFTLEKATDEKSFTLLEAEEFATKTIKLYRSGSSELLTDEVSITFSCSGNSSYGKTVLNENGIIVLEDVPSDCGNLYIAPDIGYETENDSFDVDEAETYEVYLSADAAGKGKVDVAVTDSAGVPLSGKNVSLARSSGSIEQTKPTAATGVASFENITPGIYYVIVTDPQGIYAEYDSSDYGIEKEVSAGQKTTFNIALIDRTVGMIKLFVKSASTGLPVEGAKVTVSKGSTTLPAKYTDADGRVEFAVGENVGYGVVVDHDSYLLQSLQNVMPKSDETIVQLVEADSSNAQSLTVTVVDAWSKPVEGTHLALRKTADGQQLGDEIVTGANGKATFYRIPVGKYYVFAYKPGYGVEEATQSIDIAERQSQEITIVLPLGKASIEVKVSDNENNDVAGATIRVINYRDNHELESGLTDSQGYKKFDVRVDKIVFIIVEAAGFLNYTTVPIQFAAENTTTHVNVKLAGTITEMEVALLGLYNEDGEKTYSDGETINVNPGQKYIAKLQLLIPNNTTFNEAGIHLRTGEDKSKLVEKDYIYLGELRAATLNTRKGSTYTPPTGYITDLEHLTSGFAKWGEVLFEEATEGVYELEAEVFVRQSAPQGSRLEIHYRGWGKTGSYFRSPADNELGSAESVGTKQALYAKTKVALAFVGGAAFCSESFCEAYEMEDIDAGERTIIYDEYSAKISNNYKLYFNFISIGETRNSNVELRIYDDSSAIALSNYWVEDAAALIQSGVASGSELTLAISDVGKNDQISGWIEFKTTKEGATDIGLSMLSEGVRIMEKKIRIDIAPAAELNVDILPKMIVPFINNNLLIRVTDDMESVISNATVTIYRDNFLEVSGETDAEGVFAYTLRAPNAGSTITVVVEKRGYRKIETELAITENILVFTPSEMNESLYVGLDQEKEQAFVVSNITEIPLTISDLKFSGDYGMFIDSYWIEDYKGQVIEVGQSDLNMTIRAALTKQGKEITQPMKFEGSADVYVSNDEFGRTWSTSIPMKLRIGFGDAVDDETCFLLSPDTWKIFTDPACLDKDACRVTLQLQNHCVVKGSYIPLASLEAKIVYATDNELGEFEVSSKTIDGAAKIVLHESFQRIAATVAENSENTLEINFNPKEIISGSTEPKIVFRVTHPTASGPEYLEEEVETKIEINKLSECLEFIGNVDNLRIESCPFNTGYGMYPQNFNGYDPLNNSQQVSSGLPSWLSSSNETQNTYPYGGMSAYGGSPYYGGVGSPNYYGSSYGAAYGQGYGQQYNPQFTTQFPWMNSNFPGYGSDQYNLGYNNRWRCGVGTFGIRNNCTAAVEVDLVADAGLGVDERHKTIEPLGEVEVTVNPSYVVGVYPIRVGAKIKESSEPTRKIRDIRVVVENSMITGYRDCFSISDSHLKFNDFIQRPVVLKVTNTCYSEGIVMAESSSAIQLVGAMQGQVKEGEPSMMNTIRFIAPEYKTGADGKMTQTLKFEIYKDVSYRDMAPKFPKQSATPFSQVGQLRYHLTAGYMTVKSPATLVVQFTNKLGGRGSVDFDMIIEDLWPGLDFLPNMYGDPSLSPKQCINHNALDIQAQNDGKCISESQFYSGSNEYVYRTAGIGGGVSGRWINGLMVFSRENEKGAEVAGCGEMDQIVEVKYSALKKKLEPMGIDFSISLTPDRHDVLVYIRKNENWPEEGTEIRITGNDPDDAIYVTVFRYLGNRRAEVRVPVKFCISGEGVVADDGEGVETTGVLGTGQECSTGEELLENLGMDMLLFDWQYDEISKDACDVFDDEVAYHDLDKLAEGKDPAEAFEELEGLNGDAYFCDGVQFTIAASKKLKAMQDLIESVGVNDTLCTTLPKDTYCAKDSINLPRFLLPQISVKSYQNNYYFFATSDKSTLVNRAPLSEEEAEEFAELVDTITSTDWDDDKDAKEIISETKELLDAADKREWFKDSVALIKKAGMGDYQNELASYGATESVGEYYIMTLEEYAKLNNAASGLIGLNADFMKLLAQNTHFVVGVRSSKEEFTPTEIIALGNEIGNNFAEVYLDTVAMSYLTKETYSDDLFKDFLKDDKYDDEEEVRALKNAKWEAMVDGKEKEEVDPPGAYKTRLHYKWTNPPEIVIEFLKDGSADRKDLDELRGENSKLKQNVLLELPFDGMLGGKNRKGYGIGLRTDSGENEKFFVVNYAPEGKATAERITPPNSSKAKYSVPLTYKDKFSDIDDKTNKGVIMQISDKSITFIPQDAVKITMDLRKTSSKKNARIGSIYNLMYEDDKVKAGSSLFSWKDAERDTKIRKKDASMSASSLCSGKSGSGYGFVYGAAVKDKELETIAYVPVGKAKYSLKNVCSKDTAKVKAYDIMENEKVGDKSWSSTKSSAMELHTEKALFNEYTLKNLLDMVEDEKICIAIEDDKLHIGWNETEIFGSN